MFFFFFLWFFLPPYFHSVSSSLSQFKIKFLSSYTFDCLTKTHIWLWIAISMRFFLWEFGFWRISHSTHRIDFGMGCMGYRRDSFLFFFSSVWDIWIRKESYDKNQTVIPFPSFTFLRSCYIQKLILLTSNQSVW